MLSTVDQTRRQHGTSFMHGIDLYRRLLWPVMAEQRMAVLGIAAAGVVHVVSLLSLSPLVQRLFVAAAHRAGGSRLAHLSLVLLLVGAIATLSAIALQVISTRALNKQLLSLESLAFRHALSLEHAVYHHFPTGYLTARVRDDVPQIAPLLLGEASSMVIVAGQFLATVWLLSRLDWWLSISCILMVLAVCSGCGRLATRLAPLAKRVQEEAANLNGFVSDVLAHIVTVRMAGAEKNEHALFESSAQSLSSAQTALGETTKVIGELSSGFGRIGFLCIAAIGAMRIQSGHLSVETFMSAFVYINVLLYSGRALTGFGPRFVTGREALKRLDELLAMPCEPQTHSEQRPALVGGELRVKDASFFWSGSQPPVLADVGVDVRAGARIAIIGESGAGKSTFARTIAGLHSNYHGGIWLGGIPLHSIDVPSLRRSVGYVGQDSHYVMRRSLRANLLLANPGASYDEMLKAVRVAGAESFISGLPKAFDSIVGVHQDALSGGQSQRIALARELLKNPSLLILDEATSQLDSIAEATFFQSLKEEYEDMTCLVISHRVASLSRFDFIVVVADGTVALGTHEELMLASHTYRRLYSHGEMLDRSGSQGASQLEAIAQ